MSEVSELEEMKQIMGNVRLDTAMRVEQLRKAFDKRDDAMETTSVVAGIFGEAIDDAAEYAESSEDFDLAVLLKILNDAKAKAGEVFDSASKQQD